MISASFCHFLKMHICWGQTVQIVAPCSCCVYRPTVTLSNITLPRSHTATLPHGHTVKLPHGHTATRSQCHAIILSHRHNVTISYCHIWPPHHTSTLSYFQCNDNKNIYIYIHLRVLSSSICMRRRQNLNTSISSSLATAIPYQTHSRPKMETGRLLADPGPLLWSLHSWGSLHIPSLSYWSKVRVIVRHQTSLEKTVERPQGLSRKKFPRPDLGKLSQKIQL